MLQQNLNLVALSLDTLALDSIPWIAVTVMSYFTLGHSAIITTHVARAVPFSDRSLTGTPVLTYTGVSKLRCIVECTRNNCSSFNFGTGTCELLSTYLCEDSETLVSRLNFKHYDVEFGLWIQDADTYRLTTACTTQGRCSPKCYTSTTTTPVPTTTTTTTTTPVATTTTTTPVPTTTTTTTTPVPTTTTTTTPVPTTTTTPVPTTLPPPGPGEVTYACTSNSDCLVTANADCRNGAVCECVAGYSYNPTTKTCDNGCTTFGTTYSKTDGYELFGLQLWINGTLINSAACEQECNKHSFCKAYVVNWLIFDCFILNISKLDANVSDWVANAFMEYHQRNCAG